MKSTRPASAKRGRLLGTLLALTLLAACAGELGSDSPGTIPDIKPFEPGSGGTGGSEVQIRAVGPITGIGSIVLNGVRYDDAGAQIVDERGEPMSSTDLGLGMVVSVDGTTDPDSRTGSATGVTVMSELVGTVQDLADDQFQINGVTVITTIGTFIDGTDVLKEGDLVEVFGAYDSDDESVLASRIETKSVDERKLRGKVTHWNPSGMHFRVGQTTVDYAHFDLPGDFKNGGQVRAWGILNENTNRMTLTAVRVLGRNRPADNTRAEIDGVVTSFAGIDSFVVNGLRVDASDARFKNSGRGDIAAGTHIEIEGTLAAGVLIATQVKLVNDSSPPQFEVTGRIHSYLSPAQFYVHQVRIDVTTAGGYASGALVALGDQVCVRIKGRPAGGPQGTSLIATEVQFRTDCAPLNPGALRTLTNGDSNKPMGLIHP